MILKKMIEKKGLQNCIHRDTFLDCFQIWWLHLCFFYHYNYDYFSINYL